MDDTKSPTAGDVVLARRWFICAHTEKGFGWFDNNDPQHAADLFDALAEDGAWTDRILLGWATAMRKSEGSDV